MFYNHEYLFSNDRPGLRVVWLASMLSMATATSFRRLNRNDFSTVDISETCQTIAVPIRPLALRTKGHLMFGVIRVYGKQVEYWCKDVEMAANAVRKASIQKRSSVDITAPSGLVNVRQHSTAIDLPVGRRFAKDTITLRANELAFPGNVYLEEEWYGSEADAGEFAQLPPESLTLFGSSYFARTPELGRDAAAALDPLRTGTPGHQPFTVDPASIQRPSATPLHRADPPPMDFDQFDFANDLGNDTQLNLGLDTAMPDIGPPIGEMPPFDGNEG